MSLRHLPHISYRYSRQRLPNGLLLRKLRPVAVRCLNKKPQGLAAQRVKHWCVKLWRWGIYVKRDTQVSIAYSEKLIFPISATLQNTDRHHRDCGPRALSFSTRFVNTANRAFGAWQIAPAFPKAAYIDTFRQWIAEIAIRSRGFSGGRFPICLRACCHRSRSCPCPGNIVRPSRQVIEEDSVPG